MAEIRTTYPKDGDEYAFKCRAGTLIMKTGRISPHKRIANWIRQVPIGVFIQYGLITVEKSDWQQRREAEHKTRHTTNPPRSVVWGKRQR